MNIFELDKELILPHHTLDTSHHLFPRPPSSSLPCDLILISNLGLCNRPHTDFFLGLILRIHPLFNFDNRWTHGGLGVVEALAITLVNSEHMVDFFFKVIPTKKPQAKEIAPGVEN